MSASPTKSSSLSAASFGLGAPLTSLSVMPCIWLPTIGRPGFTNVDQRSTTFVPLILTAATSTRSDIFGIGAGRLGVDDDELALGVGRRGEVQDGVRRRLDVRDALGLADGLLELLLEVDDRLERAMPEQDRLGHDVLGQEVRARLDHHDRVARAGDDQVELRVLELGERRVDDELAVDPADADRRDRAVERDLADRQRRRCGDRADDVGEVLLVGREDRDDELDVVLVALGEERPDRPVRLAGGQDRVLRGARLALDEAARDLARGVHPLLEVDRQREEIEAGAGLGAVGGAEHHGVAVADGDGAAGEPCELAGFDGQRATTELRLECLRHGNGIPP